LTSVLFSSQAGLVLSNGWRVSEVPFMGILASAVHSPVGPCLTAGREVTLRSLPTAVRNSSG